MSEFDFIEFIESIRLERARLGLSREEFAEWVGGSCNAGHIGWLEDGTGLRPGNILAAMTAIAIRLSGGSGSTRTMVWARRRNDLVAQLIEMIRQRNEMIPIERVLKIIEFVDFDIERIITDDETLALEDRASAMTMTEGRLDELIARTQDARWGGTARDASVAGHEDGENAAEIEIDNRVIDEFCRRHQCDSNTRSELLRRARIRRSGHSMDHLNVFELAARKMPPPSEETLTKWVRQGKSGQGQLFDT